MRIEELFRRINLTNAPAYVFSFALVVVVLGLSLGSDVCSKDEGITICGRNWLNAVGNFFTVLVALIAAYIAYNQYIAAERQATSATLPSLENRLLAAKQVNNAAGKALASVIVISDNLIILNKIVEQDLYDDPFQFAAYSRSIINSHDTYLKVSHEEMAIMDKTTVTDLELQGLKLELSMLVSTLMSELSLIYGLLNVISSAYFDNDSNKKVINLIQKNKAILSTIGNTIDVLMEHKQMIENVKESTHNIAYGLANMRADMLSRLELR